MQKAVSIIALSALIFCTSCAKTSIIQAHADLSLKHVSYFGFVGIDCAVPDPHSPRLNKNYIDKVSGFTNLAHLCVYNLDHAKTLPSRLENFDKNNVKALLDIQTIFFEFIDKKAPSGGKKLILRKDYKARWNQFFKVGNLKQHQSKIVAVSVADEPFWNGLNSENFRTAIRTVKKDLPDVKTIMVEAYTMISKISVPKEVDWLGFDRYGVGDVTTDEGYQREFKLLKSKRSRKTQKIVLIMETQWLPQYGKIGYPPTSLSIVAENYTTLAASEKDVVAIIGYSWVGGIDSSKQLGARNLPNSVREKYKSIGQKITLK